MITIRHERNVRHCGARERCSTCPSAGPLRQDLRAPARGPAAGARACPSSPSTTAAWSAPCGCGTCRRDPDGRRCCSDRSRSRPELPRPRHRRGPDAAGAAPSAPPRPSAVLLVGDAPYYARFGFSREKTGALSLPGAVRAGPAARLASLPRARSTARDGLVSATGSLRRRCAEPGDAADCAACTARQSHAAIPAVAPAQPRTSHCRPRRSRSMTSLRYSLELSPMTRTVVHAAFRRPDRDGRLRLDRQGHPAADRAAHRLRPGEVRGHRPRRRGPQAARRARHPLPAPGGRPGTITASC